MRSMRDSVDCNQRLHIACRVLEVTRRHSMDEEGIIWALVLMRYMYIIFSYR